MEMRESLHRWPWWPRPRSRPNCQRQTEQNEGARSRRKREALSSGAPSCSGPQANLELVLSSHSWDVCCYLTTEDESTTHRPTATAIDQQAEDEEHRRSGGSGGRALPLQLQLPARKEGGKGVRLPCCAHARSALALPRFSSNGNGLHRPHSPVATASPSQLCTPFTGEGKKKEEARKGG